MDASLERAEADPSPLKLKAVAKGDKGDEIIKPLRESAGRLVSGKSQGVVRVPHDDQDSPFGRGKQPRFLPPTWR